MAEAFTRAWMSWQKVSRHPAPHPWIMRTALNTRVSWWRRQRREIALDGAHEIAGTTDSDPAWTPLLAALRQLPQRQRGVIAFRVFLDLDTGATAKALGIAEGTVTAHLSRAVATLRGHLVTEDNREVGP